MSFIKQLFKNQNGATSIEYGLIAALIVIAAMAGLNNLATNQKDRFSKMSAAVAEASK